MARRRRRTAHPPTGVPSGSQKAAAVFGRANDYDEFWNHFGAAAEENAQLRQLGSIASVGACCLCVGIAWPSARTGRR